MNATSIGKGIASFIVFGGFAFSAYTFTYDSIKYMLETAHMGSFLLHRFLSMLLYVFFLSINVGNIIVSYATLYRSKETAYLLTKPVSHLHLFIIKFLDNFFYSSGTLFMIALSVLFGYGHYFNLPWTFYVNTLIFLFFPFMLISAAIGVSALIGLVILSGKIGMKATLTGIVVGYVGVVAAYFKMTNPAMLVNSVMAHFPRTDVYFGFLDPPASKFLPNHWMVEALYWNLKGNMGSVIQNTVLLIAVCVCCLTLMLLIAKKFYYRSWLAFLELRARSETEATAKGFFSFEKPSLFEPQTSVLMKKEYWQFFREPSQWIHLGIIALLIVIFVVSIFQLQLGTRFPYLETISYLVMFTFNAFLITSIALRFVYPIISVEGLSFWKVRSAPIKINKVYWLKYLLVVLPILVANEILMIASHRAIAHHRVVVVTGLLVSVFVAIAIVSLNLGSGAFFADFRETNPIKISSSQGATVTFLITVGYMVALVVLAFFPLIGYFTSVFSYASYPTQMYVYCIGAIVVLSALMTVVSHSVGLKAIKRDF